MQDDEVDLAVAMLLSQEWGGDHDSFLNVFDLGEKWHQ